MYVLLRFYRAFRKLQTPAARVSWRMVKHFCVRNNIDMTLTPKARGFLNQQANIPSGRFVTIEPSHWLGPGLLVKSVGGNAYAGANVSVQSGSDLAKACFSS